MSERILFVDDEPQVLEGIQRSLRKRFDLRTAASGAEGLALLAEHGPFAVVVSDMRMPVMNGVQFLAQVHERSSDSVRMILSGQADLPATIDAVNEGHIYRFLSKPCAIEQLTAAIDDGLEQFRLRTLEKVLLQNTLSGAVKMLIEILGLISPIASNRAARIQRYTVALARALDLPDHWQWGLAAHVSQIGCVSLPADLLPKVQAKQPLTDEERHLYQSHPVVAGKLLAAIPRLEDVAAIVSVQLEPIPTTGMPANLREWDVRAAGHLLIHTAVAFDTLIALGKSRTAAIDALRAARPGYTEAILDALGKIAVLGAERSARQVRLKELSPGMILDEDLVSLKGIRLAPAGMEVTGSLIVRLQTIANGVGITEPFRVQVST